MAWLGLSAESRAVWAQLDTQAVHILGTASHSPAGDLNFWAPLGGVSKRFYSASCGLNFRGSQGAGCSDMGGSRGELSSAVYSL